MPAPSKQLPNICVGYCIYDTVLFCLGMHRYTHMDAWVNDTNLFFINLYFVCVYTSVLFAVCFAEVNDYVLIEISQYCYAQGALNFHAADVLL